MVDFICDTLRMMTMNLDDPHQVEDAMEKQIEKHHHEALHPGARAADHGRRPAGARHRRGRAGHRQDHGRDQRAAGNPRPDDRQGAGRHVPRRVPRLRHRRPDRDAPERRSSSTKRNSTKSSAMCSSRTCTATPRRFRSRSAAALCRRRCSRASRSSKRRWQLPLRADRGCPQVTRRYAKMHSPCCACGACHSG